MLSQEVKTGNGVIKKVMADNEVELAEAVAIAELEQSLPVPDINNPAHGNVVVQDFGSPKETVVAESEVETKTEEPEGNVLSRAFIKKNKK